MIIHFNGHQTHSFVYIALEESSLEALIVEYLIKVHVLIIYNTKLLLRRLSQFYQLLCY